MSQTQSFQKLMIVYGQLFHPDNFLIKPRYNKTLIFDEILISLSLKAGIIFS
jgi:hypothetical protein